MEHEAVENEIGDLNRDGRSYNGRQNHQSDRAIAHLWAPRPYRRPPCYFSSSFDGTN
jgi:hypothetical protein